MGQPLQDRMLEYARCVAGTLRARPEFAKPVKGRGHAPRVKLASRNPFLKLLRNYILVSRERDFSWVVSRDLLNAFTMHMLAAGMELRTPAIIDERAAKTALAVWRLSGSPYDDKSAMQIAERVKRSMNRKYFGA